ncbi:MAG: hypothetical protein HY686_09335 [Chloroflexi bacterium]|nr:hypothetical protein [Chloroflexota bacterium]
MATEESVWQHVRSLAGKNLRSLDQGSFFYVQSVDEKAIKIAPGTTASLRRIKRESVEAAWQALRSAGTVSRDELSAHEPRNSAYLAAILATFPDVAVAINPITLTLKKEAR